MGKHIKTDKRFAHCGNCGEQIERWDGAVCGWMHSETHRVMCLLDAEPWPKDYILKRDIAVGLTGPGPVVCLYDLETSKGGGIDLYFQDWKDLREVVDEISRQLAIWEEKPEDEQRL